MANTVEFL